MPPITGPWQYWITTAGTTSTTTVWPTWVTAAGTANDTGSNTVWASWTSTGTATTSLTFSDVWITWGEAVEETKKQKADRLVREAVQRAQWEQERVARDARAAALRAEQEAAVAKAEVLLREHLAEPQRADYDRLKEFLVKAQSGRTYRIKKGRSGNVELLNDEGQPIMRFCIHPSEQCPDQDTMLAQKFFLETDEEAFDRIANKTPLVAAR